MLLWLWGSRSTRRDHRHRPRPSLVCQRCWLLLRPGQPRQLEQGGCSPRAARRPGGSTCQNARRCSRSRRRSGARLPPDPTAALSLATLRGERPVGRGGGVGAACLGEGGEEAAVPPQQAQLIRLRPAVRRPPLRHRLRRDAGAAATAAAHRCADGAAEPGGVGGALRQGPALQQLLQVEVALGLVVGERRGDGRKLLRRVEQPLHHLGLPAAIGQATSRQRRRPTRPTKAVAFRPGCYSGSTAAS